MRFITAGGNWEITLGDGCVIRLWADGYQELDGHYDFGVLVDVEGKAPDTLVITNRTPSDPDRVVISLARIPGSRCSADQRPLKAERCRMWQRRKSPAGCNEGRDASPPRYRF